MLALCGTVAAEDPQQGSKINQSTSTQTTVTSANKNNSAGSIPNIAIVSVYLNEVTMITDISKNSSINNKINLTSYSGRTSDNLSFDLSNQDVIVLRSLSSPAVDSLKNTVMKAKSNGAYIIAIGSTVEAYNLHNVNLTDPKYSDITKYFDYPSEENFKNLILFLGVKFCNSSADVQPPVSRPVEGIYHPDSSIIFTNVNEYLKWYTSTGKYHSSNPTVGIITSKYKDMARDSPLLDALVRSFESKKVNVIVGTYTYTNPNSIGYFMKDDVSIVDALIAISRETALNYQNQSAGIADLKKLNVPVLNGIRLFTSSVEEWESSPYGVPTNELYQVIFPETDGIIEPIVISGREINSSTGLQYNKPIDYQINWLTNRTISWMNLHRMKNWDKKIVITYYSEGGGKANVGADIDYYLDTPASLAKLLVALKNRGYNVGSGPLPDAKEIAKLMAQVGSNVGTWAPGELKKRVQSGNVILMPKSEYLKWFKALPADKQKEMIKLWGQPPGKLMVYTNKTGSYIVIPKIQFGNILLVPEPVLGWLQDNTTLYNVGSMPPTHQCLAFYLWMNKEYKADAIFSIFSIVELMPGKQVGLSAKDWGAILIQDMPLIHVLPIDATGQFDRRRANMLIIDFMTPTIVPSGLYGDLADLEQEINLYSQTTETSLKKGYKNEIIKKCKELGLDKDLNINLGKVTKKDSLFEEFLGLLSSYLQELKTTYMPYGSHTLGESPTGASLVAMVEAMLGDDFKDKVAKINSSKGLTTKLLNKVLINHLSPETAQNKVLGKKSADITQLLNLALDYANRIAECTNEIPRILDALEGKYIPPGPNGDPIRNPDALPTGRNLHTFDSRIIPTEQAQIIGENLAKQLLAEQLNKTGKYPQKISFLLWSVETLRHQGIMESEILYLLGVKPVRDSKGRIQDVELIDSTELGRPRIDVIIIVSGTYRDMYADLVKLIDKAVRLAAQASDSAYPNYVKEHSEALYQSLIREGYSESKARTLSMSRIFSAPPGSYSPGIQEVIPASDTWGDTDKIADMYLDRMSYVYGNDMWGEHATDLFKKNLDGIEICEFSRTSNVYGVLDHSMVAAYLGGLSLAIEKVSGKKPEMYINNLRESGSPKIETLSQFLNRDIITRYLNPKWIEGMMEHGHDGTRYMDNFVENLWIWQVTSPDLVSENMWNKVYDAYIQDKNNLGLKEFFDTNNPYAKQSIISRMLETIRKGYWNPSEDVKTTLANEYIESVLKYGVTCSQHTCANTELNDLMVKSSSMSMEELQQFADIIEEATGNTIKIPGNLGGQNNDPNQGTVPPGEVNTENGGQNNDPNQGTVPPSEVSTEDGGESTNPNQGTVSPGEVSTVQAVSEAGQSSDSASTENVHEISEIDKQNSGQTGTSIAAAMIGIILLICLLGVGYFRTSIMDFLRR